MSNKIVRNTILGIAAINLIFCIAFVASKMDSTPTEITVIPETANIIPFIPENEDLNNIQQVTEGLDTIKIEDIKPAILEGKTEIEIQEKLNTPEAIKVVNVPGSIVDIVKNEKALKCHEFIVDETITEQGKFFKQQEC